MSRVTPLLVGVVTLFGLVTLLTVTRVGAQVQIPKDLLTKPMESGVPNPFNFVNPSAGFDFSKLFNFQNGGNKKKKDEKDKGKKGKDDGKDDKKKKKKKGSTSEDVSEDPSASAEKSSSSEE